MMWYDWYADGTGRNLCANMVLWALSHPLTLTALIIPQGGLNQKLSFYMPDVFPVTQIFTLQWSLSWASSHDSPKLSISLSTIPPSFIRTSCLPGSLSLHALLEPVSSAQRQRHFSDSNWHQRCVSGLRWIWWNSLSIQRICLTISALPEGLVTTTATASIEVNII